MYQFTPGFKLQPVCLFADFVVKTCKWDFTWKWVSAFNEPDCRSTWLRFWEWHIFAAIEQNWCFSGECHSWQQEQQLSTCGLAREAKVHWERQCLWFRKLCDQLCFLVQTLQGRRFVCNPFQWKWQEVIFFVLNKSSIWMNSSLFSCCLYALFPPLNL